MRWFWSFLAAVVAANLLVVTVGIIPVGFGLMAPAGVIVVGAAFWLRDRLQAALGWRGVWTALLAGGVISAVFAPRLAVASVAAFVVSEGLDSVVWSALRRRWTLAVVVSNAVGLVADSILFLLLAFGSLAYLPGQVWAKAWWTIAFLAWRTGARLARAY